MTTFPTFARRLNLDSTIDSICTKCFLTIASAGNAADLAAYEKKHVCDPYGEFGTMWFNPDSRAHGVRRPPAHLSMR